MNRLISYIAFCMILLPAFIKAQTATEAFRFSYFDPFGTARNLGAGNSMASIGPDFSAIAINPSGLGGYGKSEFLISAGLGLTHMNAAFSSDRLNETEGTFSTFTLPNVGFIIHAKPRSGRWVASNWAIGLNRVADYNRELAYAGNTLGSITDQWSQNAMGLDSNELNGFEEGLAYDAGAIYDLDYNDIYETDYSINDQYALFKKEASFLSGGKSELYLGYGADFDHKLLVGFSFGLPIVNFTETRNYEEIDETTGQGGVKFFNALDYKSFLNTTGYGFNAKVGVTVKPTKSINIAFAFHSPTRLNLSDNFNTTLSYDYTFENHDGPITVESPYGSFQYALRTPWSASGGVGIIAGKSGFVGVHAKLTDYSSMKYKYDVRGNGNQYDQIEREVNDDIQATYGTALQLNAGGELVLNNFRVRGGVTLLQSAFNNDNSFDPSFHGGVGYRGEFFYVDLGYKLTKEDDGYLPYETTQASQPLVLVDQTKHMIATTVGFKF